MGEPEEQEPEEEEPEDQEPEDQETEDPATKGQTEEGSQTQKRTSTSMKRNKGDSETYEVETKYGTLASPGQSHDSDDTHKHQSAPPESSFTDPERKTKAPTQAAEDPSADEQEDEPPTEEDQEEEKEGEDEEEDEEEEPAADDTRARAS